MSAKQAGFRDIFNFEHQFTSEGEFFIGPYRIMIRKDHIDCDFAQNKRLILSNTFGSSGFKETVEEKASTTGTWNVTAVVEEHEELDQASVLSPNYPWLNGAYDLSVILSLLSGRHTVVGNGCDPYFPVSPRLSITSHTFFREGPVIDWTLLPVLREVGAGEAMEAILLAMTSSNVGVKLAMGSAALDGLTTRWYNNSGSSRYTKEVKAEVKAAGEAFKAHLENANINMEVINDIMPRLSNLANESALTKLTAFLKNSGMFPENPNRDALQRLKWFNVLRNSFVHSGSIRLDFAETPDASLWVVNTVAFVLQSICRIYIAKYLLKIEDWGLNEAQQNVMKFFLDGTCNGQNVLTEDHETFKRRLIDNFKEFGNIDL